MSARTKARKRALDMLYSADVRGLSLDEILALESSVAAAQPDRRASWAYASAIVSGVRDHSAEIDDLIQSFSTDWKLERMPSVDRAILRVATWEILNNDEVPTGVAIAEATKLAGEYSTEESAKFVSGLLSSLAQTV